MKEFGDKCKIIIKKQFPFSVCIYNLIPPHMRHPVDCYRWKKRFSSLSAKGVFTEIYRNNMWGDSESRSGGGSSLHYTEKLRQKNKRQR